MITIGTAITTFQLRIIAAALITKAAQPANVRVNQSKGRRARMLQGYALKMFGRDGFNIGSQLGNSLEAVLPLFGSTTLHDRVLGQNKTQKRNLQMVFVCHCILIAKARRNGISRATLMKAA